MKLFEKLSTHRHCLLALSAFLVLSGNIISSQRAVASGTAEETAPKPAADNVSETAGDLLGEWCRVKNKRVTKYTVKEEILQIRSGRSGRLYEATLTCNDAYTVCEAQTIRGWQSPVTETLRLDGDKMNLTRVWGGAWKDKTYNFTYTRCPKW